MIEQIVLFLIGLGLVLLPIVKKDWRIEVAAVVLLFFLAFTGFIMFRAYVSSVQNVTAIPDYDKKYNVGLWAVTLLSLLLEAMAGAGIVLLRIFKIVKV